MARPREHGHRITTAVRFPPDLHERLKNAAAERDVAMNVIVNKAVADYLDRLIPIDEMVWTRT
jgi:predicted HicB family RNase H-like nuclease